MRYRIKERKKSAVELEQKLSQREERLDNRSNNLDKREEGLNQKESKIDQRKAQLDAEFGKVAQLIEEQKKKLIEISGLKADEAKKIITDLIAKFDVDIIAVGNGTASRESEKLVAEVISEYKFPSAQEIHHIF